MEYTKPSFKIPAPKLKDGRNSHGQTWEDIFNADGSCARGSGSGTKIRGELLPVSRVASREAGK